jgi:hypothetical protein
VHEDAFTRPDGGGNTSDGLRRTREQSRIVQVLESGLEVEARVRTGRVTAQYQQPAERSRQSQL